MFKTIKEILEKLKDKLLDRIEKNAVRSEMSWTSGKGDKRKTNTEVVYMKRNSMPIIGDWARIYPPVNEDMSWNFCNLIFGGKKNLMRLLIILVLLGLVFYWATGIVGDAREYMDGTKYVIIGRPEFDKYCSLSIKSYDVDLENFNTTMKIYVEPIG